jgi:hypothetical protein
VPSSHIDTYNFLEEISSFKSAMEKWILWV